MSSRGYLPRLVERLLKIERRTRLIYARLAERSEFPAELREVWRVLAQDENSRRIVLERSSGLLNFMPSLPLISESTLTRVEEQVTAAEAAIQQPRLSVDDALGHALRLEDSEFTDIVDAWERAFSPSLSVLTHNKEPDEETHVRRLIAAVHTFGTNKELRSRATAMWSRYDR